jgi:hypothetical protein
MEFEFRPIKAWPREMTKKRKRAQFKAGYNPSLALLDGELLKLGATCVVFEIALTDADIRLDGRPRSGAKPSHPGVIVSFDTKHGRLSYPCDTFDRYEDNVRAIALSLEHLRAVDRYGVTKRGEQYAGWTQLPPPMVTEPPMSVEAARECFRAIVNAVPTAATLAELYHKAVMKTHPDRGGDSRSFRHVQRAKEVFDKEFTTKGV